MLSLPIYVALWEGVIVEGVWVILGVQMKDNIINRLDISEDTRSNAMTQLGYAAVAFILSILGVAFYAVLPSEENVSAPVYYYLLLWIPIAISFLVYKYKSGSKAVGYILFGSFMVFYTYVLFNNMHYMMALSVIPIMLLACASPDSRFGVRISIMGVGIDAGNILYMYAIGDSADRSLARTAILCLIVVTAVIVNFVVRSVDARQKRKTEEINKERNRFKAIVSVGITQIFEYDIKNDLLMTSHSDEGNYGTEQYTCNLSSVAKQFRYVLFADWFRFDELINEAKSGQKMVEKEMRILESQGDYRWYRIRGRVIFDDEGMPERVIGSMENIDDAKRLELRQADDSMRDPLTGLYRRPYVNQMMQEYLGSQDGTEFSGMLILDIDDFEEINNQMGNAFGDEILRNIAEDIDEIFYSTDILGRIGGDEFIILMKNIRCIEDIEKKIREIQHIISCTYVGEGKRIGGTVGIGAALFPLHGDDYDTLYENAQKALAMAQDKGHSHYCIYDPNLEEEYARVEVAYLQKDKSYDESRSGTGDSLIELAFKLIDESKDTDSAINLLIRQVVRQLELTSIVILQRDGTNTDMTVLYQCGFDDDNSIENGSTIKFDDEQWESVLNMFSESNSLVAVGDAANMEDPVIRKIMLAYGIRSFAGCAFYDKGEFVGNILYIDDSKNHMWNDDEITTIRAVTNVVSSYLLKMKAYEDASQTVERLTGYDVVTGLYKYEKFLKLTGDYIAQAEHGNYAIAYLDFSNFKYINETYGYETGDKVLKELADSLISYKDVVIYASRVFSDNIVALLNVKDYDEPGLRRDFDRAAKKLTAKVQKEYIDSRIVIDIGVCTFTISGAPVPIKNIVSNANMARKQTKLPDMPRIIFYDDQMGIRMKNEVAYANDMENAFRNREFVVYMQPKVNLQSGRIEGAEALIRWRKSDGSIIYPNDFIPVFEKNKSITLLDYYVYDEVCKYLRSRLDQNLPIIRISVNVSRVHLYSIDDIIGYVKGLINKYEIPPKYLEFELTETAFTDKVDDTITLMNRLRELGVLVSMDDFGSGYSSLNVLTKLPLDVLKLDKEFLKDFEFESDEKIIIPSVVDMAKKLKLSVVCEGVETIEQVKFLRSIGCDFAQGYYYSKPVPKEEFDVLLSQNNKPSV